MRGWYRAGKGRLQQPIAELPWFAGQFGAAARHMESGDAALRRYSEQPDPAAWPGVSREAYREYVQAFTAARRARLALTSLAAAGFE